MSDLWESRELLGGSVGKGKMDIVGHEVGKQADGRITPYYIWSLFNTVFHGMSMQVVHIYFQGEDFVIGDRMLLCHRLLVILFVTPWQTPFLRMEIKNI